MMFSVVFPDGSKLSIPKSVYVKGKFKFAPEDNNPVEKISVNEFLVEFLRRVIKNYDKNSKLQIHKKFLQELSRSYVFDVGVVNEPSDRDILEIIGVTLEDNGVFFFALDEKLNVYRFLMNDSEYVGIKELLESGTSVLVSVNGTYNGVVVDYHVIKAGRKISEVCTKYFPYLRLLTWADYESSMCNFTLEPLSSAGIGFVIRFKWRFMKNNAYATVTLFKKVRRKGVSDVYVNNESFVTFSPVFASGNTTCDCIIDVRVVYRDYWDDCKSDMITEQCGEECSINDFLWGLLVSKVENVTVCSRSIYELLKKKYDNNSVMEFFDRPVEGYSDYVSWYVDKNKGKFVLKSHVGYRKAFVDLSNWKLPYIYSMRNNKLMPSLDLTRRYLENSYPIILSNCYAYASRVLDYKTESYIKITLSNRKPLIHMPDGSEYSFSNGSHVYNYIKSNKLLNEAIKDGNTFLFGRVVKYKGKITGLWIPFVIKVEKPKSGYTTIQLNTTQFSSSKTKHGKRALTGGFNSFLRP